MPKIKIHSGISKRFKLTSTGKIKRRCAFKRHNLEKKKNKQKRVLTHVSFVSKADRKKVLKMLI